MDSFLKAIKALIIDIELEDQRELFETISVCSLKVDSNIRKDNCETRMLIEIVAFALYQRAIQLYGEPDSEITYRNCIHLGDHPRSNLACDRTNNSFLIICMGNYINSWWDLLYEISHESIHALHKFVKFGEESCTLDEGIAVKFAEMVRENYIKPNNGEVKSLILPECSINRYHDAHIISKKIPDNVLKNIREVIGCFAKINDFEIFYEMTNFYISKEEAKFLYEPFIQNIRFNSISYSK